MSQAFAAAVRGTGFELGAGTYGAHPDQLAEFVLPAAPGPLPLVVVVHGGFWRSTYDRTHTAPQCVALARAGWAVAALEYRRVGGGGGWPETFADVAAGVDAVPRMLGAAIDPGRVVLMGHSAGGHLVLWAAGRHRLPPGAPGYRAHRSGLAGVVALGAVADLGWSLSHRLGAGAARDLLGTTDPVEFETRRRLADPAALLPTGIPTVLVHGVRDDSVPLECARSYELAARAAGDRCRLRAVPDVGHFEPIDPYSIAWPAVLAAAAGLIAPAT
jgi:acetyl esterase/lipase